MPLKRFELKNEYCLGDAKLYRGDSSKQEDDPRITLEGVAVSGLVGILRQLGDLAEFASVVFHDVHQQVIVTAARGDKLLNRIQTIEEALPQLEKAVKEQKSHIHFAYIAGHDWHANIETRRSELVGSDLPEFIMDSYEECRDPPRVQLLDQFDSAGAGACLKRYSDPSYFRRTVPDSESVKMEKGHNGMKVHRKKKQRPRRTGLGRHSMFTSLPGRREMDSLNSNVHLASGATDELSFFVDGTSTSESQSKSDLTNEFTFSDLKEKRLGCIELQDKPSMSKKPYDPIPFKETEPKERFDCVLVNFDEVSASDYLKQDSLHQQNAAFASHIICNENTGIPKHGKLMQTNDVSEGSLKDPNSAELLNEPSYQNYGMVDPVIQGDLVCRLLKCDVKATNDLEAWVETESSSSSATSKENSFDSPRETGKSLPSSPSVTRDEKAEIVEHSSSKLVDVGSNKPRDLDLFSLTFETPNKCGEMVDASMLIHDKILTNFTEMVVPSWVGSTYSDLRNGLEKHLDATDGFVSKAYIKSENEDGQGVILLPYKSCDRVEWDDKMQGFTTANFDVVDAKIDMGTNDCSDGVDSAHCPEILSTNSLALVDDAVLTKEFLCQDSFDDTSGELVSEKAVYVEQPPKPELNLTFESCCHEMNSESKMKKEIVDSNLLCLESRTLETSCSSLDAYAPPNFSNPIISSSVDKVNYSTLNSHMDSFGDEDYFFSGINNIQVPENTSGISTSASENMPSTVPAATTAELQGIDTMRKSSINIWTNGGLLGLEPSKPSDISVDYGNDDMCDSMSVENSQTEVLCNGDVPSKTSVGQDRSNHVLCFPEQTECNRDISDETSNSFSKKHAKGQNACSGSSALEVNLPKQKGCSIFSAGNDIPPNKELLSVGFIRNHTDISAGISSLAHKFLELNGSSYCKGYKKLSENHASKLTSSGFCSPPLEHIKHSGQPANDSIYNKLKLELCRINLEGSMGDVLFPSFQLLSESLQPVLEDVLESEDDTFCRSCPYSSDDLLSLHSESDADVWGDDQRDASYRMVATDYIKGST